MANERTTAGPLTATVGERLRERAREGDTAGVDAAQEAVEDIRRAAYEEESRAGAATGRTPARSSARRGGAGGPGLGWALAAGLGTFAVIGLVRRAFGR